MDEKEPERSGSFLLGITERMRMNTKTFSKMRKNPNFMTKFVDE
ncbi:MAG: hypothetical protein ACI4EE_08125 [Lachnospiraceae bacterium]